MFDRRVRTVFALLALTSTACAIVDDVLDVLKLGKEIGEEVLSSWDLIGKPFNATSGVELPIVQRRQREILARLAQITRTIERLEIGIEKAGAVALYLARNGGRGTRLELRLHELSDLLSRVASADRQMREYVGLQKALERSTLEDFAEWCVSHDPGALPGLLERVHALIVPPHKNLLGRGLLQLTLEDMQFSVKMRKVTTYRSNVEVELVSLSMSYSGASLNRPHSFKAACPLTPRQSVQSRVRKRFTSRLCVTMRFAALFALFAIALAGDSGEPSSVDFIRDKFYTLEDELWKNVTDPTWREAGLGGDVELTKTFVALDARIESIPKPQRPALNSKIWERALEKLRVIEGIYVNFMDFVKRQAAPGSVPSPVREWLDLAESILLDPKVSVAQSVRKMHELLEHGDVFRSALKDEDSDVCKLQMSPHQLIYDMYNTIALTEIKGYAMMQFSWMLLRIYGKGNFTQEASLTRQRYSERTSQAATAARAALSSASRNVYACDPLRHKEGVTYAEVTRLLQGYIENEVDMNKDGTCKENCAYYSLAENHGCFKDMYCTRQPTCKGRIIDCQYIDSDMWICPASRDSSRRYEWISYENGRGLGHVGTCTRGTTKVDSWWRWLFWHCSYCMCLCDDTHNSDRYFSLWDTTSDVNNNKVVTGVRLVKHGRVFHLQVYESTLGGRGFVQPGEWVPVQKFDPSEPGVTEGEDYHTLTYERRAMDLDELDSPAGHVLTGVRFRMIGAHLHFEIRSTPFNYTTGRLSPERSQWISNDNTEGAIENPRKRLVLQRPDIPTRGNTPLPVDSTHDQYVEFTHTDFDADAAQSTVPFIDIQAVLPSKGGSLSTGAGLIHRGAPGSGGFIATKLITYDFSRHVKAEPPPSEFSEDGETTEFMPAVY